MLHSSIFRFQFVLLTFAFGLAMDVVQHYQSHWYRKGVQATYQLPAQLVLVPLAQGLK